MAAEAETDVPQPRARDVGLTATSCSGRWQEGSSREPQRERGPAGAGVLGSRPPGYERVNVFKFSIFTFFNYS